MTTTFNRTSTSRLILAASVLLTLLYNIAFFRNVSMVYPVNSANAPFLASVAILLFSFIALLLSLAASRYTIKPLLIIIFLASSVSAYFMDSYNLIIDSTMIQNAVQTNAGEATDLMNSKLFAYFLLLGVLPALLVYRIGIVRGTLGRELVSRMKLLLVLTVLIAAQLLLFSKSYASFFREHKILRYYTNPVTVVYSSGKYLRHNNAGTLAALTPIGTDAHLQHRDAHRELTILVVGETARADRFSLNGYRRKTNPLLEKEGVISFTRMHSCGTSTAVSVPCMFSIHGRGDFDDVKAASSENLLDLLRHVGINVLWRDNNSDSKGVALRVEYEDFKSPASNPVCDIECRDEGMLAGLQQYIDAHNEGDMLIVLHQMGNHGPAYYKRYPQSFEIFKPACRTSHLEQCGEEEINNAYDNAILYTDYFLSKVIALLKANMNTFETAMVYMSDHGESLGESGVYLHGLPYFIAPDAQTHVASIFWFGENYDEIDVESVRRKSGRDYSHDNLFHTLLGLMEVETAIYDRNMDIVYPNP